MPTFHDNQDRRWTIDITFDAIRRVKKIVGVNLAELTDAAGDDAPALTRLGTDIVLLCDVIFALVEPQAQAQGVTDEEFGRALGGQAIAEARTAFWEGLTDFSRSLGRNDQARAIQKQELVTTAAIQMADREIEAIDVDQAVDQAFRGDFRGAFGGSGSSSPGPSGSTPAP